MRKLVIITCLVAALVGGLVGGTVLAASRPPAGPVPGPVLMTSGNTSFVWKGINWGEDASFSQTYPQIRHISVTVITEGLTFGDDFTVRAWVGNGTVTFGANMLTLSDSHMAGSVQFDANKWEIYASDNDENDGPFPNPIKAMVAYTTTYPNPNTQNER
jgi:hypothetical protein